MNLRLERTFSPAGFKLFGEMDVSNAGMLEEVVQVERRYGLTGDVTLDLSGVGFMDSTAIGALVRIARDMKGAGRLRLVSPPPGLERVLEVSGVSELPNIDIVSPS